ncbi:MAG TPA: YqaE/Pmp3 family membrane protein [Phycisphaerales bacterium]|nr:YqaE/Pmp3 family membrane protein [Phycisphaerales bacterium]
MAEGIAANKLAMVLLAIFLPPIAVAVKDGLGLMLVISIVLTLLGWIPGMIFAVWRIVQ